jgi:teichuronic acid biosynthesis glycosyltransferase TuaH
MSGIDARPVVVWFAGASWDEVQGTDRRLVEELAATCTVFWCDPPRAAWHYDRAELSQSCDQVAPHITRVRVRALPLNSKPLIRDLTGWQCRRVMRQVLRDRHLDADLQVVASPRHVFASGLGGVKVFYQTDDWLDGAGLMSLSAPWISQNMGRNCRRADAVTAVSDVLVEELVASQPATWTARHFVLANGCYESPVRPPSEGRDPVAGLVGQLNERLDLGMLEALVEGEVPLRMVGPRADRDRAFGRRLDTLLSAPLVDHVGAVPAAEVPGQLARMGTGLTPYTQTRFNRASFPLKTLEYLAAGLAVVSTDLPAVRWLDTPHITSHVDPAGFVTATRLAIEARTDQAADRSRREFARGHTWSSRARQMLEAVSAVNAPA